jgi:hypothetical protein
MSVVDSFLEFVVPNLGIGHKFRRCPYHINQIESWTICDIWPFSFVWLQHKWTVLWFYVCVLPNSWIIVTILTPITNPINDLSILWAFRLKATHTSSKTALCPNHEPRGCAWKYRILVWREAIFLILVSDLELGIGPNLLRIHPFVSVVVYDICYLCNMCDVYIFSVLCVLC